MTNQTVYSGNVGNAIPIAVETIGTDSQQIVTSKYGGIVNSGTVTRPNDANIYASGDLIANSTTAGSVTYPTIAAARGTDIVSVITRVRLFKTGTSLSHAMFRVHLYKATPAASNGDNGAFLTDSTTSYLGYIDITHDVAFTDGTMGSAKPKDGAITFTPLSGTSNIVFLLEARDIYTPIANEVFTVTLETN